MSDSKSNGCNNGHPIHETNGNDVKNDLELDTLHTTEATATEKQNGLLPQETEEGPERENWGGKLDFLLSCLGFCVGLGNVWRFPYLCFKNGGGAFLIPYLICATFVGAPMVISEIALGQYMQTSGFGIWAICPIFQGIGIATTMIAAYCNVYYIVIIAWDLVYMVNAFQKTLPWSHCNNTWNSERCIATTLLNETIDRGPVICESSENITTVDAVVEFWEEKILQISGGIDEPGGLVWELVLALFIVWILIYFIIWKGVKVSGKIVYFTAIFPYVMLVILLIRGVTLKGALDGIIFYLKPDFKRLADAQVWIDAGTQILYSYAICIGAMPALGSYNKFKNNCYKDTIFVCIMNSATSIFAGFAIFSVLGFMAHQQNVCIENVASSGPGLAFIAYPKAVTMMPFSTFWAILFFLMILFLGLDTQFVTSEAVTSVMLDTFPVLRKRGYREGAVFLYCFVSFLIGLPMVTHGGMYVFQIFDYYSASGLTLLWVAFFESIVIAWIYGGGLFYDNIQTMIGYRINPWVRICVSAFVPLITAGIFIAFWFPLAVVKYQDYEYPNWAIGLGLCLAFSSMICIPIFAVWKLLKTPGTIKERWVTLTTPNLPLHLQKGYEVEKMYTEITTPTTVLLQRDSLGK